MRYPPLLLLLVALSVALPSFSGADLQAEAKKYALLIGINAYEHADMNRPEALKYAEADVIELGNLLKESGYEVELVRGPQATQAAIEKALSKVPQKGNSQGVVLVALAGHGVQMERDEDAYFCPYDTAMREAVRDGKVVKDGQQGRPIIEPDPRTLIKLTAIVDKFRLSPAGTAHSAGRLLPQRPDNGPRPGSGFGDQDRPAAGEHGGAPELLERSAGLGR